MPATASNPENCPPEVVAAYDGSSPPTCREGRGCEACWAKRNAVKTAAGDWDATAGKWKS